MSIRRETADDDRRRTLELTSSLGASMDPDRPVDRFEQVVGQALYANQSKKPPTGHNYPKRG